MKILLDKKNRRQLIIAGIITVFIAMIPTIANIPITYAEETSPDGKYKLVAQYSLVEELSCLLLVPEVIRWKSIGSNCHCHAGVSAGSR